MESCEYNERQQRDCLLIRLSHDMTEKQQRLGGLCDEKGRVPWVIVMILLSQNQAFHQSQHFMKIMLATHLCALGSIYIYYIYYYYYIYYFAATGSSRVNG